MTTVRHLERLWQASQHQALLRELLAGRVEGTPQLQPDLAGPIAAAAAAIIRLDELDQPHVPLYDRLLRVILAAQEPDGGWSEPMITALCLRALLTRRGQGASIDRAIGYLRNLQKADGTWPRVPLRRTAGDPLVSAFILLQLGSHAAFRAVVRLDDAVSWFRVNYANLDDPTRQLWQHASARCRLPRVTTSTQGVLSWS